MAELASIENGDVKADVKFEAGKVKITVTYSGSGAGAGLTVELDSAYFLDKLKDTIPGQIDDSVIELIKMALKAA